MSDLRKERVGITHAARLLNVSVTELKQALQQGTPIQGHPLPKPVARGGWASIRERRAAFELKIRYENGTRTIETCEATD